MLPWVIILVALLMRPQDAPAKGYAAVGPHKVTSIDFPDLKDGKRGDRRVPMTVHYPDGEGPWPLVIFSHGGGGTREAHEIQAKHLVSYGYVAICTEHVHSNNEAVKKHYEKERGRFRDRFQKAMQRITKDPEAVLKRAGDAGFAIDQAIEWNRSHEKLKGRINSEKIGVAGHSYGAHTVLSICGARPILKYLEPPGKGHSKDLSDPRVTIGIAMSPQGVGTSRFDKESFKTINRPLLCFSGSKDTQLGHDGSTQPAERRLEGFRLFPKGDKIMCWLDGADHMVFSDHARGNRFLPSKARPDAQKITKAMTLLFCDAWLKESGEARKQLNGKTANGYCGKVVKKVDWIER